MASTQTLKSSNKKCEKDEVFELANNSIEKEISRETFESLLYRLIQKQYMKLNVLGKRTCLSLPKRIPVEQRKQSNCWYWKQKR